MLELAARAMGVATLGDLTDYHRQGTAACRPLVAELVEDGRPRPRAGRGLDGGRLPPRRRRPTPPASTAERSSARSTRWCGTASATCALFDFHYRIEIYTPAAKRQYGYYVLPFLLDGEIVGRIDLKADRAGSALLVQAAHVEPGHDDVDVVEPLAEELALMASWLELERVVVADRGELAPLLATVVGQRSAAGPAR